MTTGRNQMMHHVSSRIRMGNAHRALGVMVERDTEAAHNGDQVDPAKTLIEMRNVQIELTRAIQEAELAIAANEAGQ